MRPNGRADALVAATDALEALSIDQARAVDPFAAIEALGLQLGFAKLDGLLGAVVPDGTGGVLLTTQRGPAIQRYTAAHEIGHWLLHQHRLRVDNELNVLGGSSNEDEIEAQMFAGYFLMPEPLFRAAVERHQLRPREVRPEQVYLLGRDLRVSYEAAARRLLTGRMLDQTEFASISKVGRLAALRRAFNDRRPTLGIADLWDGSPTSGEPRALDIDEHDEVVIHLPEHRLSGWRWQSTEQLAARQTRTKRARPTPGSTPDSALTLSRAGTPPPPKLDLISDDATTTTGEAPETSPAQGETELFGQQPVDVVEDSFVPPGFEDIAAAIQRRNALRRLDAYRDDLPIGGAGERTLVAKFDQPGEWNVQLHYAHAYDPSIDSLLTYELAIGVQATPLHAFHQRRLTSPDRDERLPGDPDDNAEFEVLG